MDFYSASSLKKKPKQTQFTGRHVTPLRHIILIPSQPLLALTLLRYKLSGTAANTNFILWFEPTGTQTTPSTVLLVEET